MAKNETLLNHTIDDYLNASISYNENDTKYLTADELLELTFGPRFPDLFTAVLLTVIYVIIFISGTVGNICTCIVIVQNSYMQTATNYYLFSLAISDVLILILGELQYFSIVVIKCALSN